MASVTFGIMKRAKMASKIVLARAGRGVLVGTLTFPCNGFIALILRVLAEFLV